MCVIKANILNLIIHIHFLRLRSVIYSRLIDLTSFIAQSRRERCILDQGKPKLIGAAVYVNTALKSVSKKTHHPHFASSTRQRLLKERWYFQAKLRLVHK